MTYVTQCHFTPFSLSSDESLTTRSTSAGHSSLSSRAVMIRPNHLLYRYSFHFFIWSSVPCAMYPSSNHYPLHPNPLTYPAIYSPMRRHTLPYFAFIHFIFNPTPPAGLVPACTHHLIFAAPVLSPSHAVLYYTLSI